MNKKQIDFALITSNSLMDKIPTWESYQSMEEPQFVDLIDYAKELVDSDDDHKITFLVIAEGVDEIEQKEDEKVQLINEQVAQENEKNLEKEKIQKSLREKSKSILNSIYGI